jgi:hypothetical protein
MTTETYRHYLDFMATEVAKAMAHGATDDMMVRLSVEFNAFKQKCIPSDLPEHMKKDISKIHMNYSNKEVAKSTWTIIIGVLTLGFASLILYYMRQNERKELLRELKTHLEALSMRATLLGSSGMA